MVTIALSSTTNDEGKLNEIENLDFTLLKFKLQNMEEGEGWTKEESERAEFLYKRFLKLILLFPDEKLVPDKIIDTFWHYHILDTRHYIATTENIFGEYIHHYPYFGIFGEDDRSKLEMSFKRTMILYQEVFNEPFPNSNLNHCNSGGESTCAGRCSNR